MIVYVVKNPVLLRIFNRPEKVAVVMEVLRKVRPRELYLVGDGPRPDRGEAERALVNQARTVATDVDWDCEIHVKFYEDNVGGPTAGFEGISWFFCNVDKGIVLEDDNVPTLSFFRFCDELLELYREDERVGCITGNNFQSRKIGGASHYFSKYSHCWGWASWSNSWAGCTLEPEFWRELKRSRQWMEWLPDSVERSYWDGIFDALSSGSKVHWDYAWMLWLWKRGALIATPNSNLVTNIGFDESAQNTTNPGHPLANLPVQSLDEVIYPAEVVLDQEADRSAFDFVFGGRWYRFPLSWLRWPRRATSYLLRRFLWKMT
ncbi:methyltransferase FkbM [Luminiphilus syltensis NOR5-1B]|uniref:Methyltransferase FkbM n=1 Tax=Luminiphilus syltensis NOR5-1B TaxID=565045 RepID=B8KUZ3_9GAMM|nr:methyltransferase FkbM [Luminiphilus syltensis NOR5-1B]